MAKGYVELEIPDCCIDQKGRAQCPLAWHTRFCSEHSPKGLKMTAGDWLEVYESGKRPDWCPIRPLTETSENHRETHFTDAEYRLLLSALSRERKVCASVNDLSGEVDLMRLMDSLERKIRVIQYKEIHHGKEE